MARRRKLSAIVIGALVALLQLVCITSAYAVSPTRCLFSKRLNSTAENELQGMTLENCVVNGEDKSNTSSCTLPHNSSIASIRHLCLCGRNRNLKNSHFDCDVRTCCKTKEDWICLNGGTLDICEDYYFECKCDIPFYGKRCELVDVNRECVSDTSGDELLGCDNAGESPNSCLHIVNQNRFLCESPVDSQSEVSRLQLPQCHEIPEGGMETEITVVSSVTQTPDEGPVTRGNWSDWSPWSGCSMADDAVSTGPCLCRKRECRDEMCQGAGVEVSNCTEHGHWTDWTPWSACSATRGRMGERTRYRFCSNPAPKYGGRPCDGRSESTDIQMESCAHDCPVSGSELQMTEFSSWANMTFEEGVPGWLRVRTKLVCKAPGGELEGLEEEEVARACYLLKVSVEHCHTEGCVPLRGLRKLIENNSASDMYRPETERPFVKPDN